MRYNENDGEEINGKIVITDDIEDEAVFENSCVVLNNISSKVIKANYDLTVIGDVQAETIDVAGSFTCMGSCEFQEMSIQGNCNIRDNLTVENGFVGDSIKANEICANLLEVKGNISCANLECNDKVICDKNVLISEGLTGTGFLDSKMTICGEYSFIENSTGVLIADTMEFDMPKIPQTDTTIVVEKKDVIDIEEWKNKEKQLSIAQYYDELRTLAESDDKYKSECSAYRKIMLMDNVTIPPSIKTYVEMMELFTRKFLIISNTKIYARVKVKFQGWNYDDINHSKMSKISQKDFAKMLNILTHKPQIFDEEIRRLILETLFITIGVDYEDVCNILEDD